MIDYSLLSSTYCSFGRSRGRSLIFAPAIIGKKDLEVDILVTISFQGALEGLELLNVLVRGHDCGGESTHKFDLMINQ